MQFVVYEQAHNHSGAATEVAAGFVTRIQEFAARHGVEHAAVHGGTLKKFAMRKGNAEKGAMLAAARDRWQIPLTDDNEADALWLLEYAKKELIGEFALVL